MKTIHTIGLIRNATAFFVLTCILNMLASAQVQLSRIELPLNDSWPYTRLVDSIDIDGNTIVIGTSSGLLGPNNTFQLEAYIYSADTGEYIGRRSTSGRGFRSSVAIDDGYIAHGEGGYGEATVHKVFNGVGRAHVSSLKLTPYASRMLSGYRLELKCGIDMAEGLAVVGNWYDLDYSYRGKDYILGAAYVYDSKTGALLHELVAPDLPTHIMGEYTQRDSFGHHVAIDSNFVAVGRMTDWESSYGDSISIFDTVSGDYLHELERPERAGSFAMYFGRDFDMSDSLVVVGSPEEYEDGASFPSGRVYLYNAASGEFVRELIHPDPSDAPIGPGEWFGFSIAIDGELAVVGCPLKTSSTGHITGGAYVFNVRTGKHIRTLTPSQRGIYNFGRTVAISGDKVAVGYSTGVVTFEL